MAVVNPFDFFVEDYAQEIPFAYPPELRHELLPYLEVEDGGERLDAFVASIRPHAANDYRLPGRTQPADPARGRLHGPPGARRPGAGRDARSRLGVLPRQRLASGPGPAPARPRGPLRLRLPDPAHARPQGAGRPARAPTTTSPTSMPGPRSTFPAPAGSASTRPPASSRERATSRSPRRPTSAQPRRSAARVSFAEVDFSFDMKVSRIAEAPRVTFPSRTRPGSGSTRWATRSTATSSPRMSG